MTSFADILTRIRARPDATEQMAARATLFRDRGIALDTSLRRVSSDRPDDGEHVIFYRRLPDPPGR